MYINVYKSATLASEHPTQTEYRLFAEITRELERAVHRARTCGEELHCLDSLQFCQ